MALTQTINYDDSSNFTFDSDTTEFSGSLVRLKRDAQPNEEFYVSMETSTAVDVEDEGATTITDTGVTVSDGKADIGTTGYLVYNNDTVFENDVFTLYFRVTIPYTTRPSSRTYIVDFCDNLGGSSASRIYMYHDSGSGNIIIEAFDNFAGNVISSNLGSWVTVAGTEYEIAISADMRGFVYLFINGTQFGSTMTSSMISSRNFTPNFLVLGAQRTGGDQGDNLQFRDIHYFKTQLFTSNYTAPTKNFATTSPTVVNKSSITSDELVSFAQTTAATLGSDSISYNVVLNGQDKYWNGSAWVNADGTVSQANTAVDIQEFLPELSIAAAARVQIKAHLTSSDGVTTPTLTTSTLTYNDYTGEQTFINNCLVYGYITNNGVAVEGAKLRFSADSFFQDNNYIKINSTVVTDSNGYFEVSLPETTSASKTVSVVITFLDGSGNKVEDTLTATIPNQATALLGSIVS